MNISQSAVAILGGATLLAISAITALQTNAADFPNSQSVRIASAIDCSPIRGTWFYNGKGIPVSHLSGDRIRVTMSNFRRPTAMGRMISPSAMEVTFPDDGTFIGTLHGDGQIRWNNGTVWQATQFAGSWKYEGEYGPRVVQLGDELRVGMSKYNRPTALGNITAPGRATVNFTDDAVHTATLVGPTCIKWSNGTTWTK
jgi:hypothetical protein